MTAGRVYARPPDGQPAPEVVVVGAASRDLAPEDPRGWRMGGSATYCALALSRLGLRAGCLLGVDRAVLGEGDELALLEAAGVRIAPARLERGPVFENVEGRGSRRQRWLSDSDVIPIAALPEGWRGARTWLLAPVAGEVGEEWADVPRPAARVALGLQGLVREFVPGGSVRTQAPRPNRLLERAGLVALSRHDLPEGTEPEALRALTPGIVVATAGVDGGVALCRGREIKYRAVPAADPPVDATGAGDVFLAGLVAEWHVAGQLATRGALAYAAAAASCAVEGVGLAGVPTREQVAARLRGR